jgi:hypothetical protein
MRTPQKNLRDDGTPAFLVTYKEAVRMLTWLPAQGDTPESRLKELPVPAAMRLS